MRDPNTFVTVTAGSYEVSFRPADVLRVDYATCPNNATTLFGEYYMLSHGWINVTLVRAGVVDHVESIHVERLPGEEPCNTKIFTEFLLDPEGFEASRFLEWNDVRLLTQQRERDAYTANPAQYIEHYYDSNLEGKKTRPRTEEEWKARQDEEPEWSMHPCDHYSPATCMCKGSCGCHFVKVS